ncbi:unnamed protein product [Protopolystoma xenopodis]|uniref:Uncharacterized protein n=1 Tax=Protopolystoma xenopodis TaxID=117903 RepID=A0A3S5AV85_9PLAT|nr:unnamed protein product [Protopolystoma xenopodis]
MFQPDVRLRHQHHHHHHHHSHSSRRHARSRSANQGRLAPMSTGSTGVSAVSHAVGSAGENGSGTGDNWLMYSPSSAVAGFADRLTPGPLDPFVNTVNRRSGSLCTWSILKRFTGIVVGLISEFCHSPHQATNSSETTMMPAKGWKIYQVHCLMMVIMTTTMADDFGLGASP